MQYRRFRLACTGILLALLPFTALAYGDGSTSSVNNPVHTYTAAGTYNVTLMANHLGDSMITAPFSIKVYDPITAGFTADRSDGAVPLAVAFTGTSTGGWDRQICQFGDNSPISTELNPVHVYVTPGIYVANLTVRNHLRPDLTTTSSRTIVACGIPKAAFTASPITGSAPLTVHFTDISTGNPTGRDWNSGDNGFSAEQNPNHTYTASGTHTVNLTVASTGGSTSATRDVTVLQTLLPNFTWAPADPIAGEPVLFTDTSSGSPIMWEWQFGDGTRASTQHPVHTYHDPGNYTVTLDVYYPGSEIGRTVTRTILISAPALPLTANFTANVTSGPAPLAVAFTDTSIGDGITGRAWDFGDGTNTSDRDPVHTYTAAGNYTVVLNVMSTGGSDSVAKVAYINVTSRPAVVAIPGGSGTPTDTNGDGVYDDINGNGRADFADVVLYFNQLSWIAANEPVSAFDYNSNGRIDFADVVWLFNTL